MAQSIATGKPTQGPSSTHGIGHHGPADTQQDTSQHYLHYGLTQPRMPRGSSVPKAELQAAFLCIRSASEATLIEQEGRHLMADMLDLMSVFDYCDDYSWCQLDHMWN